MIDDAKQPLTPRVSFEDGWIVVDGPGLLVATLSIAEAKELAVRLQVAVIGAMATPSAD